MGPLGGEGGLNDGNQRPRRLRPLSRAMSFVTGSIPDVLTCFLLKRPLSTVSSPCLSLNTEAVFIIHVIQYFDYIGQGCQTHFHWGPHQSCGCLQRAECNFRTV